MVHSQGRQLTAVGPMQELMLEDVQETAGQFKLGAQQ